ncbi:LCP family protein [Allobranchiibius sp. GilTou38]|uniref:LCP family protein n=1 Tax=Allobranchiibius sp. GilTou38 TaxID=2815210 RepID=UPI001AA108A1|nr:LCP family protein [Allobranchiibius sp. GilTou38]MBO1765356.1 LCP family protein [Allobranchiibius sp. GilTou38]
MTERGEPGAPHRRAQLPRASRPSTTDDAVGSSEAEDDAGSRRGRLAGATATGPRAHLRSRSAVRETRAHELRRALLLTTMSAIVPGLGLTLTRRRKLGAILLGFSVILFVVLAWLLTRGGIMHGAARLLSTRGLLFMLFVCVVGGLIWLGGILATYAETSGRRWPNQTKWMHRLFTAVLCMVIAVPAAVATNYVWVTKGTLGHVFVPRYKGRDAVQHAPVAGSDPWKSVPRVNMLFLGSDAGADRTGVRTDSIMVASIDTHTGDTTLVSIPRNLEHVPIPTSNPLHKIYPNGFYCPNRGTGHECLMDALWTEAGTNYPTLFPKDEKNPGLDTTREVVSDIVGMPIDYTVVIDLAGFQKLVDAMGGVYVNVPAGGIAIGGRIVNGEIVPGSITGRVPGGYRKLNGYQALWYSRSRVENSDDDRTRRQRCMVNSLINQANPFTMITKFTDVMSVARQSITMDIPQDHLDAFATLVNRMKKGDMRSVNLSYPTIASGNPDFAKIRALIKAAIDRPHTTKKPKSATTSTSPTAPGTSTPSSTAPANPISDTASSC